MESLQWTFTTRKCIAIFRWQ